MHVSIVQIKNSQRHVLILEKSFVYIYLNSSCYHACTLEMYWAYKTFSSVHENPTLTFNENIGLALHPLINEHKFGPYLKSRTSRRAPQSSSVYKKAWPIHKMHLSPTPQIIGKHMPSIPLQLKSRLNIHKGTQQKEGHA